MMKLKMTAFFVCFLAIATGAIFAQASAGGTGLSPDEKEIESAGSSGIEFVNYEGPQDRIDSLEDIKNVGRGLGRGISAVSTRSGSALRYQVIRAADPKTAQGFDADIIVIGPDAQVDHIRNLRWIIAGYLVQAWGYSERDAYTLAVFVTVYNAVHRGDMAFFSSRYKPVVTREISAENAGLARVWSEWPGKTRIVVPLKSGAAKGDVSPVDTSAVSGKEVTEGFRAQPDRGVPDRQAMVDIKEREAEALRAEAEKKQAEAAAAEKKQAEERAKADEARAALERDKEAAATAAAGPRDEPSGVAAGEGGKKAEAAQGAGTAPSAELATREAAVKAQEEKAAQAEAAAAAKKEEAAAAVAAADAKAAEAAQDRKDITADQRKVIAAEVEAKGRSETAGVFLVLVGNDANRLGQIVFVDSEKGGLIRKSRINTLNLRGLADLGEYFVAVSGLAGKPGGAKLVKLDKASLESIAESKAEMYPESAVLVDGTALYAIVKAADGKYYPARFSADELKEEARSPVAVMPHTVFSRVGSGIAVQTPSGAFAVLRPDSLEKTKDLKP